VEQDVDPQLRPDADLLDDPAQVFLDCGFRQVQLDGDLSRFLTHANVIDRIRTALSFLA
jgi:hypothetical protein